MKKKIVPIVLTALMLSLTACGTNSNDTVQNVSQGKLATEVVEQNVSEVEDTKESKEALPSEGKTIREDTSKESKADAEHLTNKKTESDDKEAKSEDKETVSNDKVESTTEETTTNSDSDKTETTTETPVSNETAPAQSQTFNVNIKYAGGQVWAHNPDDITNINLVTMPPVDFGNFQLTLNGDIHVASELDGWAEYNTMTEYDGALPSYEFYILVPLDAQDANKTFDFELTCPDNTAYNIRTATVRNSIDECAQYINFTYNNGTIKGTATAKGQNIWICFNVKF